MSAARVEANGASKAAFSGSNEGVATEPVGACALCGGTGETLHDGLRDRHYGTPGVWSFRICPSDGLIWLDPRPARADLMKVYPKAYYTHEAAEPPFEAASLARKAKLAVLGAAVGRPPDGAGAGFRVLGRVLGFLPPFRDSARLMTMGLAGMPPGRLLDIGCGDGFFLGLMRGAGWDVTGIEPDEAAARLASARLGGALVIGRVLEEAGLADASFDAVTASHVIEHVPDPVRFLAECRRVLKTDGRLVVVTPNAESLGRRLFGTAWRMLDPPRHFHLLTRRTIEACAVRAGLRVERVRTACRSALQSYATSRELARRAGGSPQSPRRRYWLEAVLFFLVEAGARLALRGLGEELVLIAASGGVPNAEEALARTDGNLTRAAQLLGVTFRSLRYRVKKLGLEG